VTARSALLAIGVAVVAFLLRGFRALLADMRLMRLDADDSEAVSDYVPMAASLPEADRYVWNTTIRAKGGTP